MPRAKRGNKRLQKRKKLLQLAKGYRGTKSKLYRSAKESVERALNFAYTGRKLKKRDYRSLWIVRIGAAARLNNLNYSQFMHGLKLAGIELDRKVLADLAVNQPDSFADLARSATNALDNERQQRQELEKAA
jgi:large subunit ribosomal protein L20